MNIEKAKITKDNTLIATYKDEKGTTTVEGKNLVTNDLVNAFKALEKESDEKVKDPLIDDEERRRRSKLYAERFADLHLFTDIDGNTFTLKDVQGTRMSTGSGDCAGIKVLNHAMRKGYKILGFTEFYYGPDTKERKKGLCYEPCETTRTRDCCRLRERESRSLTVHLSVLRRFSPVFP